MKLIHIHSQEMVFLLSQNPRNPLLWGFLCSTVVEVQKELGVSAGSLPSALGPLWLRVSKGHLFHCLMSVSLLEIFWDTGLQYKTSLLWVGLDSTRLRCYSDKARQRQQGLPEQHLWPGGKFLKMAPVVYKSLCLFMCFRAALSWAVCLPQWKIAVYPFVLAVWWLDSMWGQKWRDGLSSWVNH